MPAISNAKSETSRPIGIYRNPIPQLQQIEVQIQKDQHFARLGLPSSRLEVGRWGIVVGDAVAPRECASLGSFALPV
jgi:hypothetical protein